MKKIVLFTIGFLITLIGFSQHKVKVYIPSRYLNYTVMLIPDGEKVILEEYYLCKIYYLQNTDTLEEINDSILISNSFWISIDRFSTEYDFCDPKINKIRNSSLFHRIYGMLQDSISKYIGGDHYKLNLSFEKGFKENVCSDTFSSIFNERFDVQVNKIKKIYESKVQRAEWIKKNHANIDKNYIESFLIDFNNNEPDEEAFIQILIAHPATLIEEIDKLDYPYQIIWRVERMKNIEGISKVIESLENIELKSKTKRQVLRELKKKEG